MPVIRFCEDVPRISVVLVALSPASFIFFAVFSKDNDESWEAAAVETSEMESNRVIRLNKAVGARRDEEIAMKSKQMSMLY